jgi:hypothetical protein
MERKAGSVCFYGTLPKALTFGTPVPVVSPGQANTQIPNTGMIRFKARQSLEADAKGIFIMPGPYVP